MPYKNSLQCGHISNGCYWTSPVDTKGTGMSCMYEYMKPPITITSASAAKRTFTGVQGADNGYFAFVAHHITFPCTNNKAGCPELLPMHLLSGHKVECPFGTYKCPFSKISNVYCARYHPLTDLKSHVLRDHKWMSLDIYGEGKFYSHLSPLTHTS